MSETRPGVLPVEKCSVCRSARLRRFRLGEQGLLRCTDCGMTLSPTFGDPDVVYDDRYHSGETGLYADTTHPLLAAYLVRCNTERMAMLEQVRPSRGRLLDVGCAQGGLLKTAEDRGWQVTGVEPAAAGAAEAARRITGNVHVGTLATVTLPAASFDVVSAFHVLEHVPDVVPLLAQMRDLIRDDGLVLVEVPNWRSINRLRRGGDWVHIDPVVHISHFSPRHLTDAFRRAGLRAVLMRAPSWVGPPQTLGHALDDLGIRRLRPVLRRLTRPNADGGDVLPTAMGWRVLRGVSAVYSRTRIGYTLFAAATPR